METSETFGPLKAALECPRLYIFNYVSELKNHVDLECQNFLHDQENSTTEQSITALAVQSTIINDINRYELDCYQHLEQENSVYSELRRTAYEAINNGCYQAANEILRRIQEQLFLNKTCLFIASNSPLISDLKSFEIKSFGVLVIVEDKFISFEDYLNRNKLQERLLNNENSLALEFLRSNLRTEALKIKLELDKVDVCDLRAHELTGLNSHLFKCFTGLKNLDLSNNKLIALERGILQNLSSLEVLNLSHNQLTVLDPKIFNGLDKLNSIYLSYNQLDKLSPFWFAGLTNLETIDLDNNLITELDVAMFNGLSRLESLGLSHNKLKRIHAKTFRGLIGLKKLFLMENQLTGLEPGTFEMLSNLRSVDVSNNMIREVDANTFRGLDKLEFIGLGDNQLRRFDAQVTSGLKKLMLVFLKGNKQLDTSYKQRTSIVFSSLHLLDT